MAAQNEYTHIQNGIKAASLIADKSKRAQKLRFWEERAVTAWKHLGAISYQEYAKLIAYINEANEN